MSEAQRLAAVDQLRAADPVRDERLERFARLAAALFDCESAAVCLIDAEWVHYKAVVGDPLTRRPRSFTLCDHVIAGPERLALADARQDPRFRDNPAVTGEPHARFYAGRVLYAPDGSRIGTLCAWDRRPRPIAVRQLQALDDLAAQVEAEFDHRELLEAKRRLEESEQRYRALFEPNPDAVFTADLEGRFTSANAAAAKLGGYAIEELLGRPFALILPAEVQLQMWGVHQRTLAGEPQQLATRLVRKDGNERIVEITTAPHIVEGVVVGCAGIAKDVTERVSAEQRLRESELKYRSLFEQSLDGVLLVSLEGAVLAANPAVCRTLERSEEELAQYCVEALIGAPAWQQLCEELWRSGNYRGEMHCLRNGGRFPVEVSAALIEGGRGRHRVGIVVRDISERKNYEAQLAASREDLRRLSGFLQDVQENERRRIARELHDELGQCLAALKLDVRWLRARLERPAVTLAEPKLVQMERTIEATVESMRRLAANLRPVILDDLGLAAACEWLLQDFGQRSGLECHLHVEPEELSVPEHVATACFRIVQEALTNVARHARASRVDVFLQHGPEELSLVIGDDGIGMQPGCTLRRTLGLIGMRERCHALGGRLTIDSAPDEGVRLQVSVPVQGWREAGS